MSDYNEFLKYQHEYEEARRKWCLKWVQIIREGESNE